MAQKSNDPTEPILQLLLPPKERNLNKKVQFNRAGFRITVPTTGGAIGLISGASGEETIVIGGHIGVFSGTARSFVMSVINNQGVDFLLSENNTSSKKITGELVLFKDDVLTATFAAGAPDVALYQGWISYRSESF